MTAETNAPGSKRFTRAAHLLEIFRYEREKYKHSSRDESFRPSFCFFIWVLPILWRPSMYLTASASVPLWYFS